MGWNEDHGAVTASFEMWRMADREQRVFLTRTAELIDRANKDLWNEIPETTQHRDPAGIVYPPDRVDIFYDQVGGLMPHDHHWHLCASVLKDAVTTFEVYLESAMREVWSRTQQAARWNEDKEPYWPDLEDAWKRAFGAEVETDDVAHIRHLRNLLTHRRGKPRSQAERERFGVGEYERVALDQEQVLAAMTTLADQVRRLDPLPHAAAWGPDEGAGTDYF